MLLTIQIQDEWLALDRSARLFDQDGRLHIERANISKANVCPYYGKEIPNWLAMGLDGEKVYKLYRHPDELQKAAKTANNIQLLSKHVAVNADDHKPYSTVGSTGTDAVFEYPYLKNSLVVWSADAIDDIKSCDKRELSCAYRYTADMTPGEFQGEQYDGVMRDIQFNHVALVREGRAGPDVCVGDNTMPLTAKGEEILAAMKKQYGAEKGEQVFYASKNAGVITGVDEDEMKEACDMNAVSKLALRGYLLPKLAVDQTIDFGDLFKDKDKIIEKVNKLKLAKDANLHDFPDVLKAIDQMEVRGEKTATDQEEKEKKEKAEDQEEEEKKEKEAKDRRAKDEEEKKEKAEDAKRVLETTVATAVKQAEDAVAKRFKKMREAEQEVQPWVGRLEIACDSADEVYQQAFKVLGVDVKDVDPSAYKTILNLIPKPETRTTKTTKVTMDAAATKSFNERYPDIARIKVVR